MATVKVEGGAVHGHGATPEAAFKDLGGYLGQNKIKRVGVAWVEGPDGKRYVKHALQAGGEAVAPVVDALVKTAIGAAEEFSRDVWTRPAVTFVTLITVERAEELEKRS